MHDTEKRDLALRMVGAVEKIAVNVGEMERLMALHSELTLKLLESINENLAYIAENASEENRT